MTAGAAALRDAATVLILRDGSEGLEVFMLRRNLNSDFVGGAYVFPGGAVDDHDRHHELGPVCQGRSDTDASRRLGIDRGGLAYWVAAIRESFEEAGVLLAYDDDGMVDLDRDETLAKWQRHRVQVDAGQLTMVDLCRLEGLRLAVDGMHYFGHWITPEGAPRRYDTRFFLAAAPANQTPLHDDHEVIANEWVRPADAIDRAKAGELTMMPPTLSSLRAVARFGSAAEALAAATEITDVPTILPRVVSCDGGVRIVLPGDPAYDGPLGVPDASLDWMSIADANAVTGFGATGGDLTMTDAAQPSRPELVAGVPVALGKLVRRVLCDNPGMMTGPGTNTYLVGIDEIAVIDPGPADEVHLDAVAAAGSGRIRWILCTHTHGDHSPGAAGLKERTGAEVLAFEDRDGLVCDRHLADGDSIEGTEFTLRAIHTPGHAGNHLCFLLERDRLLFTGDHVMDGSTVVITPTDGDMSEYLRSIERLEAWRPALAAIAPAHGHLIEDPAAKLAEYRTHRVAREAQVAGALAAAGPSGAGTAALVTAIYTDVPEVLHPVARFSVWAHLRKLADEGRALADDPDDPDATWHVS